MLLDVSLLVDQGDHVTLLGPSGSGKTTLLSIIGGLERPESGSVVVAGHDLRTLTGNEMAEFRRNEVGFVFQHFGLLDAMTAVENVELALLLSGTAVRSRRPRAKELLGLVGLGHRLNHRPPQLSGGERQRVAIARALANRPALLLADEPTGNLDEDSAAHVGDLLESLRRDFGCTLLVVTHHHDLAARAEHRYMIREGRLARAPDGRPDLAAFPGEAPSASAFPGAPRSRSAGEAG